MPSWFDREVQELKKKTEYRRGSSDIILFYGSSSFTLWHDMAAYFPSYNILNLGFGGSTLADCLEYFDTLVTPFQPRAVILYGGDNDLDNGSSPERVLANVEEFIVRKRRALGDTPMAYVSIKVSPARLRFMHKIGYTNRIVERALAGRPDVRFVDVTRPMVARGYHDWRSCFHQDPLHMSPDGYQIWGKALSAYLDELDRTIGPLRIAEDRIPSWFAASEEPPRAVAAG